MLPMPILPPSQVSSSLHSTLPHPEILSSATLLPDFPNDSKGHKGFGILWGGGAEARDRDVAPSPCKSKLTRISEGKEDKEGVKDFEASQWKHVSVRSLENSSGFNFKMRLLTSHSTLVWDTNLKS